MTTLNDIMSIGKEVEKIVNRLIQGEKTVKSTVKSAKSMSGGTQHGGVEATFGGLSDQTKQVLDKYSAMGGGGGVNKTALFGGAVSALGSLASTVPGLNDAYGYKQNIFNTAFAGPGQFSAPNTFGAIKAGFGAGMDATGVAAAARMTNSGIGPNSARFGSTMQQAGAFSAFDGRSNAETTSGMIALQKGTTNVASRLASIGVFVTNPRTGVGGSIQNIVDQLWVQWYGSKNHKPDPIRFENDLLGGSIGKTLSDYFGDNPDLYQNVLEAVRMKAKNGGVSVSMNLNDKGPNSISSMMSKAGIKSTDTPWQTTQGIEQGRMQNIADSSDALIKGFEGAAAAINTFNSAINRFINTPAGQAAFGAKGFGEGVFGSQELGGLASGVSSMIGNMALARMAFGKSGWLGKGFGILKSKFGGSFGGSPNILAGMRGGAGNLLGKLGQLPRGGMAARTGMLGGSLMGNAAVAAGAIGTMNAVDWLDDRNFSWAPDGGVVDRLGRFAGYMGGGAATGAMRAGPFGAVVGAIGGAAYGAYDWITNPHGDSSPYMGGMFGSGKGTTFGRGMGADLPKKASDATSWASQAQGMSGAFVYKCDHYVAQAYGLAHSGYETARAHWNAIPDEYKYPGDRNPPAGSLVFWNVGNSGHVALGTGNGSDGPMVSTTHVGGTPTQMSLAEATRQLGGWGTYYGWSKPYFGGKSTDVGSSDAASSDATGAAGAQNKKVDLKPMISAVSSLGDSSPMSSGLNTGGILSGSAVGIVSNNGTTKSDPGAAKNDTSVGKITAASQKNLIGILKNAGFSGKHLQEAWAIVMRESTGHATSHNPHKSTRDNSYGLFQINMFGSLGPDRDAKFKKYVPGYTGYDSLLDPDVNARAAAYLSQKGNNWKSWRSPTYGKAAQYLSQFPGGSMGMYLEKDQLVNAHAGEMIVPASQTTQLRELLQDGINGLKRTNNVTIHVHVKNASREEATRLAKWVKEDIQKDSVTDRMRTR